MFEQYLGIQTDYIVIGVAAVVIVMLILLIVQAVRISKLQKKYNAFMQGKDGKSLEKTVTEELKNVDELNQRNELNEAKIEKLNMDMEPCFQKIGLEKYDALDEMGGKLSFALALLNAKNNGFIINSVHSREGSYSYIKEIIDGNSIIGLSPEEEKALSTALNTENE